MRYATFLEYVRIRLAADLAERRLALAPLGFVGGRTLEGMARAAAATAIASMSDVILADYAGDEPRVMAWSPAGEDGAPPGDLRAYMRAALAATLAFDLEGDVEAALLEGQDADTLPNAVREALAAHDAIAAGGGTPHPHREALGETLADVDGFEAPLYRAFAESLATHLEEAGAEGAAEALRAARQARGSVAAAPAPGR